MQFDDIKDGPFRAIITEITKRIEADITDSTGLFYGMMSCPPGICTELQTRYFSKLWSSVSSSMGNYDVVVEAQMDYWEIDGREWRGTFVCKGFGHTYFHWHELAVETIGLLQLKGLLPANEDCRKPRVSANEIYSGTDLVLEAEKKLKLFIQWCWNYAADQVINMTIDVALGGGSTLLSDTKLGEVEFQFLEVNLYFMLSELISSCVGDQKERRVESETHATHLQSPEVTMPATLVRVDLQTNEVWIEGDAERYKIEPHLAQIVACLVQDKLDGEPYTTGASLLERCCTGKNISREINKRLKVQVPPLWDIIKSSDNGYFLNK